MSHGTQGIVLFGHGARNAEYLQPFLRIQARVRAMAPDLAVEIGFLELTQPPLETAIETLLAQGVTTIRIVPIFFAPGRHVLKDLPELVANLIERHPQLEVEITPCVGEGAAVIDAMAKHALAGLMVEKTLN